MIDAYRLTDSLFAKPYCKVRLELATSWVEQGLARWCKGGKAIQQTEAIVDPSGTGSALSRADRALTSADSMANAGAEESDDRITAARCKVQAWPSVGAGKLTQAPLPAETGGVRLMSRAELESLGTSSLFDCSETPVDIALRKNRRITTRLIDDDFVQQTCEDDLAEADELDASECLARACGDNEVEENELDE